jgi:4-hydroxyacetophenone monooxygenase
MTGDVDDRYLPMLAFELGLLSAGATHASANGDTDAPGWTKAALAPGRDFRVAVIGAGMSGLAVAYRLLQAGLDFVVFERNDDVGGVRPAGLAIQDGALLPPVVPLLPVLDLRRGT